MTNIAPPSRDGFRWTLLEWCGRAAVMPVLVVARIAVGLLPAIVVRSAGNILGRVRRRRSAPSKSQGRP